MARICFLAHALQFGNAAQIDQLLGAGQPLFHGGQQGLSAGQGLSARANQALGIGQGGGTFVGE